MLELNHINRKMEKKSAGFEFGSEEYPHKLPFVISVKKTYIEEYSFVPDVEHWHYSMPKKAKGCSGASRRMNNDTDMVTSRLETESQLSCTVSELPSNPMNIITHDMNTQPVSKPQMIQDSKLSLLFPNVLVHTVGSADIDLDVLHTSSPGSHQLWQMQRNQFMATTTNKPILDVIGLDIQNSDHTTKIQYESSYHEVPILEYPSEETMRKASTSAVPGNAQTMNYSFNSLRSAETIDTLSSMNSTCTNTLLISKNPKPVIPRKLLNINTKGVSPWPEMPRNVDVASGSQEFRILHKMESLGTTMNQRSEDAKCSDIKCRESKENEPFGFEGSSEETLKILSKSTDRITRSLETNDFVLKAVGNITNESEMGLSLTTNHSEKDSGMNVMLSLSKWANGDDLNPLQIPWPEIMKEITYNDDVRMFNRVLNEEDTDVNMLYHDFSAYSASQSERPCSIALAQVIRSPALAQPSILPEKDGIQQMSDEEQIVPQSFEKIIQKAIQEPTFEENVDNLRFHQCPEMIQEVVLTSNISKSETENLMLERVNDPLSYLEHHNYNCKINEDVVVPLSSSPWIINQFNMSIAELNQCCSPIKGFPPKIEKNIENIAVLDNENELDEGQIIEEFQEVIDTVAGKETTDETCCNASSDLKSGKVKEDMQICLGEVRLESISDLMNAESKAVDEQTVPNLGVLMKSTQPSSIFTHTFEFEDFYSNSFLKKRVKTCQVDGSSCRPLRLGLSKKRRVSPLHNLTTIGK